MKLIAVLAIFGFFSHLFAPIIKANSVLLVDQFERENIAPWQVVQNEGSEGWDHCLDVLSPAKWQIKNGWIKLVVDGIDCTLAITPTQNNEINSANWQVDFDWRLDESINMDRNFVWWWQDENNWYDIKLYGTGVDVQKVVGGVSQPLAKNHTTFPFQANEIYHFTIKYQNHEIFLSINGKEIINTIDLNPLTSETKTIALKTSLGSKRSVSSFDNLQVFSLPQTPINELSVQFLKQTDPKWSNFEYDKATSWSNNPTIGRWGCALTATTMVMKYHQLLSLPNGQEITPISLNDWLLSQPDGYIGEGLLNWLAISRLSAEINKKYGTPKLEYQRISGSDFEQHSKPLSEQLPLIFNIDGHFLVSTGYDLTNNDFTILDPFYIYRNFSQHQKELLSSRLFTPSYTDLSYLLLISKTGININIKSDRSENLIIEQFVEKITDQISGEETTWQITQIKKPIKSNYTFEIANPTETPIEVSFYSYNKEGNFVSDNFIVEKENYQERNLDFDPDSSELMLPNLVTKNEDKNNWSEITQLLQTYYSYPTGKYWPIFDYFLELTNQIDQQEINKQIAIKNEMVNLIEKTPLSIEVTTNLLKALNSLNLVI